MAPSPWRIAYRAAALEPDNARLEERVKAAQAVMMSRLVELVSSQGDRSEIRAIEKGLRTLVVIKWERLGRSA